ncbi:RNA ligase family protein [Nocardia sp. NPDC059246]|uniref:RNA ligase family protein n=1 Tax=unclassified Nocardia TaxID=2637762 RepID=UPI0036B2B8B8
MNLDKPKNDDYAGVVTSIKAIVPLAGRDLIVGVPVYGHQAIVPKEWNVGDLGVFFPAEVQLSDEYAHENNLYRHENLNRDHETRGYLEDNRRVKAIKLGGHRSNALFMPLSSLAFTGIDPSELKEGDTFDTLHGVPICQKYEVKRSKEPNNQAPIHRDSRVDNRMFPQHLDTGNWWRMQHVVNDFDYVYVTQKLHGTSIRIGRPLVQRKLTLRDKFGRFIGAKIQETEYDSVYGSRRVIKDANLDQNHFYDSDIWTREGRKLDGLIPDGFIVYGELVGWTPSGEPIQRGYTYQMPKGKSQLYVYRVVHVNPQGIVTDLSWKQVTEFCRDLGLKSVPLLWQGFAGEFDVDEYMNERYEDWSIYRGFAVPMEPGKLVDEGVVVRIEGRTPRLLKAKSPEFLEHETKMLDEDVIDLESLQAA